MVKKFALSGIIAAGAAGIMLSAAPAQAIVPAPAHGPQAAKPGAAKPEATTPGVPKPEATKPGAGSKKQAEPGEAQGAEPGEAQGAEPGEAQGAEPGKAQGAEPGKAQGTKPGEAQGAEPGVAEAGKAQAEAAAGDDESGPDPQSVNPYDRKNVSETLGRGQDKKPYFWKKVGEIEGHENETTKNSRNSRLRCGGHVTVFFGTVDQRNDCINDAVFNSNSAPLNGHVH